MTRQISPLRYPGSKAFLTPYMFAVINANLLQGVHFVEPFAGGASMALNLLDEGLVKRVSLVERDPLIAAFWKSVVKEPEALCRRIRNVTVSINTWYRVRKLLDENSWKSWSTVELGFAGLFLNRTCYSGIISAGPIGGISQNSDYNIDCRFNKTEIIRKIEDIATYAKSIKVYEGDGIEFLVRNRKRLEQYCSFVFVDPPYFGQGKRLYRYHYSNQEHKELAKVLQKSQFSWIATYDHVSPARRMFNGSTQRRVYVDYSARTSKKSSELIISNVKLPRISYS